MSLDAHGTRPWPTLESVFQARCGERRAIPEGRISGALRSAAFLAERGELAEVVDLRDGAVVATLLIPVGTPLSLTDMHRMEEAGLVHWIDGASLDSLEAVYRAALVVRVLEDRAPVVTPCAWLDRRDAHCRCWRCFSIPVAQYYARMLAAPCASDCAPCSEIRRPDSDFEDWPSELKHRRDARKLLARHRKAKPARVVALHA